MARMVLETCLKCNKEVYMEVEACKIDDEWLEVHECPECGNDRYYELEEAK